MKEQALKDKQENDGHLGALQSEIATLTESVNDKDMLIQVANQQIKNHQKMEDKLKNQLVEVEKNQKASSSQLESNLNQKIKQLDKQNEEQLEQITELNSNIVKLKHDNGEMKAKLEQMTKDAEALTKVGNQNQIEIDNQKKLIQQKE